MLCKAGTALVLAALIAGHMPPKTPRLREIAAELHQAQPQAQVKAGIAALFQARKG